MNAYNLTLLTNINDGEDSAKSFLPTVLEFITKNGGEILSHTFEGRTTLADTFKKHNAAYLSLVQFNGNNETLDKLNRHLSISENVPRYVIVRLETIYNPDQISALKSTTA